MSKEVKTARVVLRSNGKANRANFTTWVDMQGAGFDRSKPVNIKVESIAAIVGQGLGSRASAIQVLCDIPQGPSFDTGCLNGSVAQASQVTMLGILPMYNYNNTSNQYTFLNCNLPVRPIKVAPSVLMGQNVRIWLEFCDGNPCTNGLWSFANDQFFVCLAVTQ
jgi:hypothetical protein